MTLIGGEPGIGKSTLLLQAAARLEAAGRTVLYASGEESPDQIRLRADRLVEDAGSVHVFGETRLEAIIEAVAAVRADVVVIDSIQTIYTDALESAPGNVGQVRECSGQLMRFAKDSGTSVIVVGHVTKGGGIAGPKTLEHIVDTVLYFEGEATLDYRLLRTTKNRFGSVDELGVFSMTESGLVAVPNPSAVFLAARADGISGSAVTALMEGTRPVLVEVQALAAKSGYGTPQRVATGIDPRRLAVLLAVLERRAETSFANLDVFVQVTAGVRLNEPGADLAVAAALLSSLYNRPAPADVIFLGEIGLGGEIRPSGAVERRIAEAVRLGFHRVFGSSRSAVQVPGVSLVGLDHVDQLVRALAA
jgi:DNA repair protein RadA/Sms